MYPKVGIRPTIDGRRKGIRESLEDQTMNMAKAAAELISKNLRYTDGTPVQCVIADTTIGGVAEAAACADKFRLENVGVSLTVTPCWCYGSETMDMDPHTPKAVWGFNGTERPGAVTSQPFSPHTLRKGFRHSASTDAMSRTPMRLKYRTMWLKRFSVLPAPASPLRKCAANPTFRSAPSQWVSPVRFLIPNFMNPTSTCAANPLI